MAAILAAQTPETIESVATGHIDCAYVSNSYDVFTPGWIYKSIAVYDDTTGGVKACMIKENSGVAYPQTPIEIDTMASSYIAPDQVSIVSMTEDFAIAVFDWSDYCLYAVVIDTSGDEAVLAAWSRVAYGEFQNASVAKLSDSQAVISYMDLDNSNHGTACLVEVTKPGSVYFIAALDTVDYSQSAANLSVRNVAGLSGSLAIVVYNDYGNSQYATGCLLTVADSEISAGTPQAFNNVAGSETVIAKITATTAVTVYYGTSGHPDARVLSVSGATISAGTVEPLATSEAYYANVTMLSETNGVSAYNDHGAGDKGKAVGFTISGTTISTQTPTEFYPTGPFKPTITPTASHTVLIGYVATGAGSYASAVTALYPAANCAVHVPIGATGTIHREELEDQWLARVGVQTVYKCSLENDENEEMFFPASSVQIRLANGTPSYLSATIPGFIEHWDNILARKDGGTLRIYKGYYFPDDDTEYLVLIISGSSNLATPYSKGATSGQIQLTANTTTSYGSPITFTTTKVISQSQNSNDKMHIRVPYNVEIDSLHPLYVPGDTITDGVFSVEIGTVSIAATVRSETVDITEA